MMKMKSMTKRINIFFMQVISFNPLNAAYFHVRGSIATIIIYDGIPVFLGMDEK